MKNKKNKTGELKNTTEGSNPIVANKFIPILKTIIPVLVAIQLWLFVFRDTEKLVFQSLDAQEGIHKRTVLLIISILLLIYSFLYFFRLDISNKIKNVLLLIYSTILIFLVFEVVFMYQPISQGTGYAYCNKLWFNKYWQRNEIGYRDEPYNAATDTMKNKIVMLGDSYVAGHGTNNVKDRMSNLLEKKLGKTYRVFNLGKNGSTTIDEFDRLKNFPYKYDKLILVHVPNDLEYLDNNDETNQIEEAEEINNSNGFVDFFIKESFFINFLSYTIIGDAVRGIAGILSGTINTQINEIPNYPYSDSAKLRKHFSNLLMIDKELKEHQIKLLIVSFPFPGNEDSKADYYYQQFIKQLKLSKLNYLDAMPICNQLKRRQQVVSALDGHPSVKVQQMVTDSIFKRLKDDSWIP
jgi:hypothetical protein